MLGLFVEYYNEINKGLEWIIDSQVKRVLLTVKI